ncbi:MAG TPA: hypothetical protein VGR85_12955 [Candidatus Limnocylindria bacterium]|nr:hypothetical protein [Candidatus Limnocylindria bacterium]
MRSAPLRARQPDIQDREGVLDGLSRPTSADLFDWLFAGVLAHPSGGVAGWRDRRTGRLSDEYPEISGYFLSAAVFADATGSAAVVRAADWLCARIEANASASRRVDGSAIYNFDQGIIAAGLIKYGVRAGNARAVAAGIRAASRLRDQVNELGHLPTLDPNAGQPHGRPATWSTVGRLHLAKTVQCLLLAAELGVAGMREAARSIIDDVSSAFSLASDGLRDEAGRINLHATCYALEGLWIWDAAHRTADLHEILHTALGELVSHRLPSGGFPRLAATAESREQSDVHAQVVRLAALLGRVSTVRPSIARLRQVASPAEFGWSLPYQPQALEVHENAWATMFAAQALALVDGPPELDWWELI